MSKLELVTAINTLMGLVAAMPEEVVPPAPRTQAHAELRKTWQAGQKWEFITSAAYGWIQCKGQPHWNSRIAYRQVDPHAELRKTWKEGQKWEYKAAVEAHWAPVEVRPMWHSHYEYRQVEVVPQTRRQQLIAAGVPEAELAKIVDERFEIVATGAAMDSLSSAFNWRLPQPQGYEYWEAWYDKLSGQDVTIPEPLDAMSYCVIEGDMSMCGSGSDDVVNTLEHCQSRAQAWRKRYPRETYKVMRLVPV